MSVQILINRLKNVKGKDVLPLAEVKKLYMVLCARYNWTPSHEGLVEYNTLLNNQANWKRGIN